jgi:hypothetical protein
MSTMTNFMTQFMQWLHDLNDSTETDGVKMFPGGVLKAHQTPIRTPAIVVEIPERSKSEHLNMGQTHTDMKYTVHIQIAVQGRDPSESQIMADDLCKVIRWYLKEADYKRTFEGINDLTHGDCHFYSLERADDNKLLVIVARQAISYTVEEEYEEIGPLVSSVHARLRDWEDSITLKESIEGTPEPEEPEEEEPEEGE